MWGLRPEEVIGQHLLGLDIGPPTESLKPMVLRINADEPGGELHLTAVNRRGKTVPVRVLGSALRLHEGEAEGAVLVMEEQVEGFGGPV